MTPMDPDTTPADTSAPEPGEPDGGPAPRGQGRTLLLGAALVAAVLVVAVVVVTAGGQDVPDAPEDVAVIEGSIEGTAEPGLGLTDAVAELPDATLEGFGDGAATPVADLLGGRPLVLNFWATWCAPCVAEMPDLQRLHDAGGDAVHLVGINTQDAAVNAEPFVDELGITYDLLVDRDGSYFNATGSFGMPTTLLVHPDGRVAYRHTGPITFGQLAELVAEHLDVDGPVDS